MTRTKITRLYCACTPDKYEFIVAMADSCSKLAQMIGYDANHIHKSIRRDEGKTRFTKAREFVFRIVEIEEDE